MARTLSFMSGGFIASKYPELSELIDRLNQIPLPIAPDYAKYPGHTPLWNAAMDICAENLGWSMRPFVDTNSKRIADWRGDFHKIIDDPHNDSGLHVFVEIELGNAASAFRNLAKFDLGMKLGNYDFFMLGVPGRRAKEDIAYATSFDEIVDREELYQRFIHSPCIIFEIEPLNRLDVISASGCDIEEVKGRMGPEQSQEFIRRHNLSFQLKLE